jgi:hypothetical protein
VRSWRRAFGRGVLVALLSLPVYASAVAAAGPTLPSLTPSITLGAAPHHVRAGHSVRLTGRIVDPLGRRAVNLEVSPYPYSGAARTFSTTAAPDGTFAFVRFPDRNTRYRVMLAGTAATARVQVEVAYPVRFIVKALPLGHEQVTIIVPHPRGLYWFGARVRWWFALGYHGRFFAEPATHSHESRRGLVLQSKTISLPAGHFRFKACFNAPATGALLNPGRPAGCQGRGYAGSGEAPYGFPSPRAVNAAASYLAGRAGRTAFAVVDSQGRLSGVHVHWTFVTASVVKAMLLVAYLRQLDAQGQHYVDGYSDSILYPMINVSDNSAASAVYGHVGDGGLYALAGRAGMTDFNVYGSWGNAQLSAADQARYFFEMDSLIPREFVGYARRLLSTIVGYESWGVPAVARPHRYAVFFKGGWRGTALGQLVHQVARLERPDHSFAMAVMTDGDPSMGYGIDTIQGLTNVLINTR